MNANREDTDQLFDDDAPDLSTPEWVAKFANGPVNPGEPIDPDSLRSRNLPDGTTVVSYDLLPIEDRGDLAAITGETSPATALRSEATKRSSP